MNYISVFDVLKNGLLGSKANGKPWLAATTNALSLIVTSDRRD